ncbi:RepA leader peptide Tap [Escherichia coli]|nr:RepA leader peptide Tap [Escherichia coli]
MPGKVQDFLLCIVSAGWCD